LNASTGFYYFDSVVKGLTKLLVALPSNVNAVLFNNSVNLTTFNTLQLTNSIKFITDYTVATNLSGDGLLGSCVGTCYL